MKKVIFIDDNPLDQFILKRILTKYNLSYEVNCTDNAEEVLAFLEQNKWDKNSLPDIILLDIYMPQFNGWEFLEKVQDLYPTLVKPLKIYILSSSINPADITYSRQYSCVKSFLFKPITREVLEHVIKEETSDAI